MYMTADDMPRTIVSFLQKCGTQSITQVMGQKPTHQFVATEDALAYRTRVMFLRHPSARIESCWSFFRFKRIDGYKLRGTLHPDVIRGEFGKEQEEWESFVDHFLLNDNPHWDSQVKTLTNSDGVFTPTVVHKFEDIMLHWEKYAVGALPWENAFSKIAHSDYRVADIDRKYAADLALWESL